MVKITVVRDKKTLSGNAIQYCMWPEESVPTGWTAKAYSKTTGYGNKSRVLFGK